MAFLIVELGVFHQLKTESIYLYHANIINHAQTRSHSWLKNWMTKTRQFMIVSRVIIQDAICSDVFNFSASSLQRFRTSHPEDEIQEIASFTLLICHQVNFGIISNPSTSISSLFALVIIGKMMKAITIANTLMVQINRFFFIFWYELI